MESVAEVPEGKGIIGTRTVIKNINNGKVKTVIFAKNCPAEMIEKIDTKKVSVKMFQGDEALLGTKLGKPFPVAMVGYEK